MHVDHFQTSIISNITLLQPPKVIIKEIYDISKYKAEELREIIKNNDRNNFNIQKCAEGMYTFYTSIIENAIRKPVLKKKVSI